MSGSTSLTARNKGSGSVTPSVIRAAEDDCKEKEEKIRSGHGTTLRRLMVCFLIVTGLLGILVLVESKYKETPTTTTTTTTIGTPQLTRHAPPQILLQATDFEDAKLKEEEAEEEVKQQQQQQQQQTSDVEAELVRRVIDLDNKVRRRKAVPGIFMEVDQQGLILTKQLQDATRELLIQRYGTHDAYRVKVDLTFPSSALVPAIETHSGHSGYLVIEMAPIDWLPVSVFYFLELARTWKKGAFHRNAPHVLQVWTRSDAHGQDTTMPFQEYSEKFPHVKGVAGFAGRPSGPEWYVNILDNTADHGPGTQQKENPYEADSNFGRVVEGMDTVIARIHAMPQHEFFEEEYYIKIPAMHILVSQGNGEFVEWSPQ